MKARDKTDQESRSAGHDPQLEWRHNSFRSEHMKSDQQLNASAPVVGTRDGTGAGDDDQPYQFGWRPRANAPYPFNTRQYSRLLVLRSRVRDGLIWREAA
jgi:hypothetical protein